MTKTPQRRERRERTKAESKEMTKDILSLSQEEIEELRRVLQEAKLNNRPDNH